MQIRFIFSIIVIFTITSCKKEKSDETSPDSILGNAQCKACIYIPMCDSSIYSYYDTIGVTNQIITDTILYKKDTMLRGLVYEQFYSTSNRNHFYSNCTNGISREGQEDGFSVSGILHRQTLDANLPVTGTWADTVPLNLLLADPIQRSFIIAKGVSRTVNGLTFNDVIHVRLERRYLSMGISTIYNTVDFFYARSVGLIEAVLTEHPSQIVRQHKAIRSYFIP